MKLVSVSFTDAVEIGGKHNTSYSQAEGFDIDVDNEWVMIRRAGQTRLVPREAVRYAEPVVEEAKPAAPPPAAQKFAGNRR